LLHLAPEAGALEDNRALIETATTVAADMGAAWVVSGELVVSGYRFQPLIGTDWITSQPDRWMRRFAELTASLGVVSIISHPERDNGSGKLFNTLFIIGREGHVLGRHQKLHPTPGGRLVKPRQTRPAGRDRRDTHWTADLRHGGLVGTGQKANGKHEHSIQALPIIVCNRTGVDGDSQLTKAESVVIDKGRRLTTLRSPDSTIFRITRSRWGVTGLSAEPPLGMGMVRRGSSVRVR
jgi:predicted amidohydrolase